MMFWRFFVKCSFLGAFAMTCHGVYIERYIFSHKSCDNFAPAMSGLESSTTTAKTATTTTTKTTTATTTTTTPITATTTKATTTITTPTTATTTKATTTLTTPTATTTIKATSTTTPATTSTTTKSSTEISGELDIHPLKAIARASFPSQSPLIETLQKSLNLSNETVIFTSNNSFAPGRHHKVVVKSSQPFEGFMIQISDYVFRSSYGDFVNLPPLTKTITCPGDAIWNSVIDSDDPVLQNDLNLTWRASENIVADVLKYRASFLYKREYQILEGTLHKVDPPPSDSSRCGYTISCFRACPEELSSCTFTSSIFAATAEEDGDDVIITMGSIMTSNTNYMALGQTTNNETLANMDLNVCYTNDEFGNDVHLQHLYLLNRTFPVLTHQGNITLDSSFMDGNMLWCKFKRPFRGRDIQRIDIDKPTYFFFFAGHQENGEYEIPSLRYMMRTPFRIGKENRQLPMNQIAYLRSKGSQTLSSALFVVIIFLFYFVLNI